MTECHWDDCTEMAVNLFCETHYPAVFDSVASDARLVIEKLRLEQRWSHFIYLLANRDGTVKLGYTAKPSRRLEEHERAGYVGSSAVVCRGSREVEAEIIEMVSELATEIPEVYTDDERLWTLITNIHEAAPSLWQQEQALKAAQYDLFPRVRESDNAAT